MACLSTAYQPLRLLLCAPQPIGRGGSRQKLQNRIAVKRLRERRRARLTTRAWIETSAR
jgi:hypothetical protein